MVVIKIMSPNPGSRLGIRRPGAGINEGGEVVEGPVLTMGMLEISCLTLWYERDVYCVLFPEEVMTYLEAAFRGMYKIIPELEVWRSEMESRSVSSVLSRRLRLEYFDP